VPLIVAAATLACAWLLPLDALLPGPFSAHMTRHMAVVAVAAPLLALALTGSAWNPVGTLSAPSAAVVASLVELVAVWSWHAPALHTLARTTGAGFAAEQAAFLASALLVWAFALGGARDDLGRSGSGVVALLLTSMHMTLLGALLVFAGRPLYDHEGHELALGPALADQHLGGAIMLLAGGSAYLAGGLWLSSRLVRAPQR
jgi:putative membrane protein